MKTYSSPYVRAVFGGMRTYIHTLPTVHGNGTSSADLIEGYKAAFLSLSAAIDTLAKIEFHARDYYPQGPEAWPKAREEREAICTVLRNVEADLLAVAIHVQSTSTNKHHV